MLLSFGSERRLGQILTTTGQDRLEFWQIHDIRFRADPKTIEGPGGASEEFLESKDAALTSWPADEVHII